MPSRMRHLFDQADAWAPLQVQSTPQFHLITIDLPGLTRNEVNVMVDAGVLTFRGQRDRSFMRSISLPEDVEDGGITVQYAAGTLTIRMPRTARGRSAEMAFREQ